MRPILSQSACWATLNRGDVRRRAQVDLPGQGAGGAKDAFDDQIPAVLSLQACSKAGKTPLLKASSWC